MTILGGHPAPDGTTLPLYSANVILYFTRRPPSTLCRFVLIIFVRAIDKDCEVVEFTFVHLASFFPCLPSSCLSVTEPLL